MTAPRSTPRYSVHVFGTYSSGWTTRYLAARTLSEVRQAVRSFAGDAYLPGGPGCFADVYPFNPADRTAEAHGDRALMRLTVTRRGIRREAAPPRH